MDKHMKSTAKTKQVSDDRAVHQATIRIVYDRNGREVEAAVSEFSPDFEKAILLIEDTSADSDWCREVLHEMGYNGIQLITNVHTAKDYLDDVLNKLTHPPDAIVLDIGLGYESGFEILRKRHANPKLVSVPILVWTSRKDTNTETFSMYLGADDFLVKSRDKQQFRETIEGLLKKG
jgi:DNA-binding response OmpR family regulator